MNGVDFYSLDTNLFRAATKLPEIFGNLVPELRNLGFRFGEAENTALRISPFGLLEVLGIRPKTPRPQDFRVRGRDPKFVYEEIFGYARNHFASLPELQRGFLLQKHEEQLTYVHPQVLPLFEECVTEVLARDIDVTDLLAAFLATDYFFKQPFPKEDFISMLPIFSCMFFMDLPENSPTSRFRISVRVFNHIKAAMQGMPAHEEAIQALGLKNQEDFLDTDIIQDLTYGFPYAGGRHRVIVLTFDKAKVLLHRALFHRQLGDAIAKRYQSSPEMQAIVESYISHPGGIIVQADQTGHILKIVDLPKSFASLNEQLGE